MIILSVFYSEFHVTLSMLYTVWPYSLLDGRSCGSNRFISHLHRKGYLPKEYAIFNIVLSSPVHSLETELILYFDT